MQQLVAERLASQGLSGNPLATDPVDATRALLAVQAQDPLGARLTLRARTTGFAAAAVDAAISNERSLAVSWLCRGTLHLVNTDDLRWLHALLTPRLRTGNRRRLQQEGLEPKHVDKGLAVIRRVLRDGPLKRAEIRDAVRRAGVPAEGQGLVHLLFAGVLDGDIMRGPISGKEQSWVLAADWLGSPLRERPEDRETALRELALRYLRTRSPASATDLAKWSGLSLGAARRGLRLLGDRIAERPDGLLELSEDRPPPPRRHPPRLLGPFDELLLGWADRTPITGESQSLVTVNGLFRPFLLVDGKAAGLWRRDGERIARQPLEPMPPRVEAALDADAADLQRFLATA